MSALMSAGPKTETPRRAVSAYLTGFVLGTVGIAVGVASAWLLGTVLFLLAYLLIFVAAAWLGARSLLGRGRSFGAEVLAVSVLNWVLVALALLWTGIVAGSNEIAYEDATTRWTVLVAAAGLAAVMWATTRYVVRRPLAARAGPLAVCFLAVLVTTVPVLAFLAGAGSMTGDGRSVGVGQGDVQASYRRDRASLLDGVVETPKSVTVEAGSSERFVATVCGPASTECGEPVPAATTGEQRTPMKTGARISAWAVSAPDVQVSPADAVVQPIIDKSDDATWEWYVKPARAGDFTVSLHFRVLRGETSEALTSDKVLNVTIRAEEPPRSATDYAKATGGWFKEYLGWLVGLIGALGITGPMILTAVKAFRARRRRPAA